MFVLLKMNVEISFSSFAEVKKNIIKEWKGERLCLNWMLLAGRISSNLASMLPES